MFGLISGKFEASYKYDSKDFKKKNPLPAQESTNFSYHFYFQSGYYEITFGEERKIANGIVKMTLDGITYSSKPVKNEKTLKMKDNFKMEREDLFGNFLQYSVSWDLEGRDYYFMTNFNLYPDKGFIIFEQHFPEQIKNRIPGKYTTPTTQFPCFENESLNKRIFTFRRGLFYPPSRKIGTTMAPVLFFDDDANTFMLCPMNNYLVSVIHQDKKSKAISCGLNGEIGTIPENYSQRYLLYFGKGINNTFKEVGDMLLKLHGAKRKSAYDDPVVKYLGYWTNNGATYYYRTAKDFEGNKLNYSQTMEKLNNYIDERKIPIRYIQLDSWWYKKAARVISRALFFLKVNGTLLWEPREEVFPEGMMKLQEKIQKPFCAHARWFDGTSPYVKQYNFELNGHRFEWGMPKTQEFWDDIMSESKKWGLICYEQDWLANQYNNFTSMRADVDRAKQWLQQMATAAAKNDITVQYCMANAGMILQALELPSVTHARVANDYNRRIPKKFFWPNFTQANIYLYMVGIWPFIDNFASFTGPERMYVEKYPTVFALIASLGGGVVGPSDKIGFLNKGLLMKTCRSDGLVFKPDRPITPIDLMFLPHRKYYLNSTESVKSSMKWTYILALNIWPGRVKDKYFKLKDFNIDEECVVYDYTKKTLIPYGPDQSIFNHLKKYEHNYFIVAPLFDEMVSFIGTPDKFVTCSNYQFPSVIYRGDVLEVMINDLVDNEISLVFYVTHEPAELNLEDAELLDAQYQSSANKYLIKIKMTSELANVKVKMNIY